jgi:hypothetical protein
VGGVHVEQFPVEINCVKFHLVVYILEYVHCSLCSTGEILVVFCN